MSLFTIDEGWEQRRGDNEVDHTRFPNGLEPVFAAARADGMKAGLWLPVALVAENSQTYTQHPNWVCRGRDGKPKLSQGQGVVMCLASPYKHAVVERISEAVRKYNLSYVKLDLTTVFNTYGEAPGCFETGHEHANAMESSERIYEALDYIGDALHQRFPSLLIDYTYELWGEKHIIDYGLLHVADLDWLSNVHDHNERSAGPRQVRTLLYQRGMAIPVETMLIGNLQTQAPKWQEQVGTAMGFAPLLLGDPRRESPADLAASRSWIDRFNKLRREVDIEQSFFPLGSWRQPKVTAWDGFGRFADSGEGLVVLFRNEATATEAQVEIPGFPDGRFTLTSWTGEKQREISGADLRSGIQVALPSDEPVQVLEVRTAHP
jgi:alpha-galactosidase